MRIASRFVTLLVLCSLLVCFFPVTHAQTVDPTVYIKTDGSVDGTDKITRNGDVYIFTDDVSACLFISRDNIIIMGNGHTLQGIGVNNSKGIYIESRNKVTVQDLVIDSFDYGICIFSSANCTVKSTTITSNLSGGEPWTQYGVLVLQATNCSVTGCTITNANCGISVQNSGNIEVSGNIVTANGRGIELILSQNSLVSSNYAANNDDGIVIENQNNQVRDNVVTNNKDAGIYLYSADLNEITGNNITNNARGMHLMVCNDNTISNNNFVGNTVQVDSESSQNTWSSGQHGNYWGDYNGADSNHNGIGDTAYVIDENNQDDYPLMTAVEVEEIPEFSSWTVMLVVVAVLALILLAYKRKL
jgi:parallel beta-helix repeat protein